MYVVEYRKLYTNMSTTTLLVFMIRNVDYKLVMVIIQWMIKTCLKVMSSFSRPDFYLKSFLAVKTHFWLLKYKQMM